MKIRKAFILAIIASMLLGVVMVGPVAAATTVGVEPQSTIDTSLGIGSTFNVSIWIRNVANLVGLEFKLGYDTTVLTATSIAYGGIFGVNYFPLINKINDTIGLCYYGIMEAFGEPAFNGDGCAAIIFFSVDSVGQSKLDLYGTKLGDTSVPLPKPIPHVVIDGYFRNALISVTLIKRKAWPEHHAYETLWDEDTSNDLFAAVSNEGDMDTWVKVVFTVVDSTGIPVGKFETVKMLLPVGSVSECSTAFVPPELGRYDVSAVCWADTNGDNVPDTAMGTVKTFSFKVGLEFQ